MPPKTYNRTLFIVTLVFLLMVSCQKPSIAAETNSEYEAAALSWMQHSYLFQGIYPPKNDPNRQWVSRRESLVIGIRLLGLERKASRMSSPNRYMEIAREIGLLEKLTSGEEIIAADWWDQPVTREWTARWLLALMDERDTDAEAQTLDYLDSGQVSADLRSEVIKAKELGLMTSYPDGTFRPGESVSFDTLARILTRIAYLRGNGSQVIKGQILAADKRNLLVSENNSGKREWYYLNQWASVSENGKEVGLEEVAVGREALLLLHDNREISNLELLEGDYGPAPADATANQGWQDIADYLVFATEAPDNVEPVTQPPVKLKYHNLFPIQGTQSLGFDGHAFWVYAPYHRQIFLFDTQGTHRETLEIPDWLQIDTLTGDNKSILAYNQTLKEWYRLRPVYYPLDSASQGDQEDTAVKSSEITASSTSTLQMGEPGESSRPGRYCLLYCGGVEKQAVNRYTARELLPLVAYVDNEGKIEKPFFNSFVLLSQYSPLLNGRPLGRDLPLLGEGTAGNDDLQAVFDEYFAEGRNLNSLEETVGEVARAIDKSDYQVDVYLGIPTPQARGSAWPGLAEDMLPEQVKVFKVPEVYAVWSSMLILSDRFEKQGFKHLKLAGFYYQTEQGYPGDKVQESFPQLCRYLGLRSIAIPGVTSSYPLNFKKDGFDTLMIQSSHVFIEPPTRYPRVFLDEASIIAQEGPTGFLIELPYDVRSASVQERLYETIRTVRSFPASIPIGCFQGFDYLSQLSRSGPELRMVYDTVYHAVSLE